jgi:hypothetical protein
MQKCRVSQASSWVSLLCPSLPHLHCQRIQAAAPWVLILIATWCNEYGNGVKTHWRDSTLALSKGTSETGTIWNWWDGQIRCFPNTEVFAMLPVVFRHRPGLLLFCRRYVQD